MIIVNGVQPLTIITKRSILDVAAALDLPLVTMILLVIASHAQRLISVLRQAVACRCSVKKLFLKISQNSQENTCAKVFVIINLRDSGTSVLS